MSTVQTSTILDKIRSRGYWRVVIRPTTFQEDRIEQYSELFPIVEKNAVRLREWDYPHVDQSNPRLLGDDWVGQEFDWEDEIEVWRLYQSGQFVHFFAVAGDWRDQSTWWPADLDWQSGRDLYYSNTIYSLREIYEFAARLALSPAGAPRMLVKTQIHGLNGRRLMEKDNRVFKANSFQTQATNWTHSWEGQQTELMAKPRELSAKAAHELLARFGYHVSPANVVRVQERMAR